LRESGDDEERTPGDKRDEFWTEDNDSRESVPMSRMWSVLQPSPREG
jgi:hypothetical protein